MHLIDSQNAGNNNEWVAGDPTTGTPPTSGTAAWFNAVQFEIANYILSRGIDLNKSDNKQLIQAINKHIVQSIQDALKSHTPTSSGNDYIHPTLHPANIIQESDLKRFVSGAQIAAWNSKADSQHFHAAETIQQDSKHRFVSDQQIQQWNAMSEPLWDSGWFAIKTDQRYVKEHTAGRGANNLTVLIQSTSGEIALGNNSIFNTSGNGFYGNVAAIDSNNATLVTGNGSVFHGIGIGNHWPSGFARLIIH